MIDPNCCIIDKWKNKDDLFQKLLQIKSQKWNLHLISALLTLIPLDKIQCNKQQWEYSKWSANIQKYSIFFCLYFVFLENILNKHGLDWLKNKTSGF